MAGTDVDSIRVFHIVSIQRFGDAGRRAFYSCAGKKQDRISADKTAGCQDRAFCVGAYTLALPFRNEIYLDNISAFDSIHHSTFDARPDSRPLDGEDSQAVLISRSGQIICQDGHYHKKRCCIVICCKLVCYKMLPFWMFRHCFVTY